MKLILDDGTEAKIEEIKGPAVLIVQPQEKVSYDELKALIKSLEFGAKEMFERHHVSFLIANADVKFTLIRDQ